MKHFSKSKLCLLIGSLGVIASGNVGAFPSAAWFPSASGTTVAFDSNGDPLYGFVDSIKPKPVYINGQKGLAMEHAQMSGSGNDLEFFSVANDGFYFHGDRFQDGTDIGCTEILSPPARLPDDIVLGQAYETTGTVTRTCIGNPANSGSGTFTATFTPLLFEDVTLPAGTFKALKMELNFVASGGLFDGVPWIYEHWRAPKIGTIKDIDPDGPWVHQAIAINSNVPRQGNADFDDDGRSDRAVFRPADGTWHIRLSNTNTDITRSWGIASDRAVATDYDGDGKMDFAVWRPSNGTWYILKSSTNFTKLFSMVWGITGDQTVQRDYDGDGVTDIAVFRPSNGTWYIRTSSTGFTSGFTKQFGISGDNAVPRDFDGDGKADLAVFRKSNGKWYVSTSSSGYSTTQTYSWGINGDQPIARDFDGDGKADLGLYRPSNGTWYIKFSTLGYTTSISKAWGIPFAGTYDPAAGTSDIPVSGDFDGDRLNDIAVFRPTTGNWHVLTSSSNFTSSLTLSSPGTTGDLPLSRK